MMHGGGHGWRSFINLDESQAPPRVNRDLLQRVYGYAKPYMGWMMIVLTIIFFTSLIQLVPPLLYRDLFDNVIPHKDLSRLHWLAMGMVGIPILRNLLDIAQRYYGSRLGEGIIFDLRQDLYNHLQAMSLRFFTHTRAGEIVSRFNSDVVGAQSAVTNLLPNLLTSTVTVVATLIVMASIDWRLTLLAVLVVPLFIIPTQRAGLKLRSIRRESMEYNADLSSIITETLGVNGALLTKVFGRQRDEQARFRQTNQQVRDVGIRMAVAFRWMFLWWGISATLGSALVYWAGGFLAIRETITAGTIVAFVAYLSQLYAPISVLSNTQVEFITSMVSFERVFDYLNKPLEVTDRPNARTLQSVAGRLIFEDVSFDYTEANERLGIRMHIPAANGNGKLEGEEKEEKGKLLPSPENEWALRNLSFEIQPGQLAALVGPSGAGKTTLTYLIPRLYDPTSGRILLDGHDLRDLTQESLAAQIGMVAQETYLFHDTIRANLAYARKDASDAELVAALKAANIYDFVQSLPDGLDTLVGERGYRLSGGEKQRMAIARVVLKDPRLLILDEATSHLDSTSEALIQAALEPLMKGRTSLVIAHRLSTILAADVILVMDEGRLVESGTHADLLARGGLYAQLYETQFHAPARK